MTDVSYVPGDRTAIVGEYCWVLIDATPHSAVASAIWRGIEQGSRLDVLVADLLKLGFEHVPEFVMLAAVDGRHHLICRGRAGATLVGDDPLERVDGQGLTTWLEYQVAGAVRHVVLGKSPGDSDLRLPASAGVFLAHSVCVDLIAASRDRGRAALTPPVPFSTAPALAEPGPGPGLVTAQAARHGAPPPTELRPVPLSPGPRGAVGSGPTRWADPDGDMAEGTDYDFLFGATQSRTVEDAAVRPAAEDDDPSFAPPIPVVRPPALPPPLSAGAYGPVAAGPEDPVAPNGLIDAVPWTSDAGLAWPANAPAAPLRPPPAAAGPPDDGSTVMRTDLPRYAARPMAPDRISPMVQALLCPNSHASPPTSSACRVCGAPLPQQDLVTVPRPPLGVLRLSTGDVITLDRGVVMGRAPRTDLNGEERPHVVKLPSGDGEISRTHLQVSLEGWQVLVADLNSTNGTLIGLPGREPEHLRPGEPTPIQVGTLVILAVGIEFRYEAAK
jgi:FHA domain